MFTKEEIVNEVAKELGLKKSVVEQILTFQFRFLREKMESGEFKIVKLNYFGKFYPNGKYKYFLNRDGKIGIDNYVPYKEKQKLAEETKRNLSGVEERSDANGGDNGISTGES